MSSCSRCLHIIAMEGHLFHNEFHASNTISCICCFFPGYVSPAARVYDCSVCSLQPFIRLQIIIIGATFAESSPKSRNVYGVKLQTALSQHSLFRFWKTIVSVMARLRQKTCSAYIHCDSWSQNVMSKCEEARRRWLEQEGFPLATPMAQCELHVGTDCSGTDAPVIGLEAISVKVKHVFACDIAWHARSWIESVTTHKDLVLYEDMLERDFNALPSVNAYYCGFPCKPWSLLNNHSKFFNAPNFQPFLALQLNSELLRQGFFMAN